MIPKDVYAGLDVSQETTSICVVDGTGATVWRGSCPTDPASIAGILRRMRPGRGSSAWNRPAAELAYARLVRT